MPAEPTDSNNAVSEAIFIAGLKNNDQQVFAQMYQQFSPPLYAFIVSRVKDTEVAENLLQDVFVKAWRNASQYDPAKGRLFIWMYKICSNCCIDYLRSKQHRINSQSVYSGDKSDSLRHYVAVGLMPDRIGLHNMLNKLSTDEREVLELVYFKGFTQAEVAGLKNIPLGTVKTRCSRAIKKLRSFFDYNQLTNLPPFVLA
jgi:RNA polymerase sigma factor (sigma-70 family)